MNCLFCQKNKIKILKDFDFQPRCFDFKKKNNSKIKKYKFILAQCEKCTVIQLKKTGPNRSFFPKFKWINNREPNKHYLNLAKRMEKFLKNGKRILFISEFDQIIFNYLKKKYGTRIYKLNSYNDLGIKKRSNQFLIQEKLINLNIAKIKKKYGTFDFIVSCRLLEHSYNIFKFVKTLKSLLSDDGEFIFEIPNSFKPLKQGDVAMLWEEHSVYLTPNSSKLAFNQIGYKITDQLKYKYPQEDALVLFIKKNKNKNKSIGQKIISKELKIGRSYVKKVSKLRFNVIKNINRFNGGRKKTVIFGAGHRAMVFINILDISKFLSHVVDDDKNKKDLYIPGTHLRVKSSKSTLNKKINLCLLSLDLGIEPKIINNFKKIKKNINFFSISPDSKFALPAFKNSI